jgi:YesN/AraC family two-component response regulator
VLEAVDGEDAAEKFAEANGGIALVILDFTMPKMNGVEALGVMRSKRRDVKTLFMSGYSEEMLTKKGMLDPGQKFILKPFSPNEMLQSVREALAAAAG